MANINGLAGTLGYKSTLSRPSDSHDRNEDRIRRNVTSSGKCQEVSYLPAQSFRHDKTKVDDEQIVDDQ